jgi:hypothetical protein
VAAKLDEFGISMLPAQDCCGAVKFDREIGDLKTTTAPDGQKLFTIGGLLGSHASRCSVRPSRTFSFPTSIRPTATLPSWRFVPMCSDVRPCEFKDDAGLILGLSTGIQKALDSWVGRGDVATARVVSAPPRDPPPDNLKLVFNRSLQDRC